MAHIGRIGCDADGTSIYGPDVRVSVIPDGHTLVPLRGSAYTMAVLDADGGCVGWCEVTEATGFDSVRAWMERPH